jgi:hypothetical protein
MSEKIQSIGTLWKKEKLATLEWEVSFAELLLEAKDPWPGYYDHFEIPSQDQDLLPRWIFAVLRNTSVSDQDNIIRITAQIKKVYDNPFDCVPGKLTLNNEVVSCMRLQVEDYNLLPDILNFYTKHGLEFAPTRKVPTYESLIKITKFFDLSSFAKNLYTDNDLHDTYYIIIPNGLSWETFEKISETVKNNSDHQVYDAALASAYEKSGVIDMVRIYDRETSLDILSHLRNKYRSEVERIIG